VRRIIDWFRPARPNTADAARERLQMLLAIERRPGQSTDFLPKLQNELLEVIRKYVDVDQKRVSVEFERGTDISVLEVNIELPADALERQGV
jgi:cell division topological specificity factor